MRWHRLIIIFFLASPVASATTIDKLQRLAGVCTNQFHIRNDILTYIDSVSPRLSHPWKALIRIAYNQQFIYYHAKTYQEAEPAVKENSVAMRCLSREYKDNEDYDLLKHIESMMANTEERRRHIFEASNNLFGSKGISYAKLSKEELDSKCESGVYA